MANKRREARVGIRLSDAEAEARHLPLKVGEFALELGAIDVAEGTHLEEWDGVGYDPGAWRRSGDCKVVGERWVTVVRKGWVREVGRVSLGAWEDAKC